MNKIYTDMELKNCTGLWIFLGLLSIAIALPEAVSKKADASRTVTVKGLCEKEVDADRAIWPIVYKEGGNSLEVLSKSLSRNNTEIISWLKAAGIEESEISISSPKVENMRANGYSQPSTYDFVMTSVITVCTSKVPLVIDLQTRQLELLDKGIAIGSGNSWEYPVTYEFTGLNDIKPEMIEQATFNAREAAGKFAQDSGSKVGKIVSASQGQFSVNDRDANTPYIKTVRVVTTINYRLK